MKKIFVVDNYDSFTYNLVHILKDLGADPVVKRNDQFELEELEEFDAILLSPGPGIPEEAGLLKAVIERYAPSKQILGVCLGHQAISEVFGAKLENLDRVFHGVEDEVQIQETSDYLFKGLASKIQVGRYHSWVVSPDLPEDLEQLAVENNGQVMAVRHKTYDVRGIQFHPESVMTPSGKQLLQNWIEA